jgi:peptide deformylase
MTPSEMGSTRPLNSHFLLAFNFLPPRILNNLDSGRTNALIVDTGKIKELHVVKYPDPVLHRPAELVRQFDENLEQLTLKMIEIMRESKGVGLAANQVGIPIRLFVANPTGEPGKDLVFINNEITDADGWVEGEEGCLSVPQIYVKIRRHQRLIVRAVDAKGRPFELQAADLLARVVQHESDHLDGRLILDRMSIAAKLANRRQIKYLEELAQE